MEGTGRWFDSQGNALAYASEHFKRGARSFDVGCFQINYKWHHEAFASIEAMFDPLANALYAARFLSELHAELGDWDMAAGAYHSRTPEYADRYRSRFKELRQGLLHEDSHEIRVSQAPPITPGNDGPGPGPVVEARPMAPARVRVNTFPLLQGGTGGAIGSLVPLGGAGGAMTLFQRDDAS